MSLQFYMMLLLNIDEYISTDEEFARARVFTSIYNDELSYQKQGGRDYAK